MKKKKLNFEKLSEKLTKKEMVALKGGDEIPGTYNPKINVYDNR